MQFSKNILLGLAALGLLGWGCGSYFGAEDMNPAPYNTGLARSETIALPAMEMEFEGGGSVSKAADLSGGAFHFHFSNLEPLHEAAYVVWGVDTNEDCSATFFKLGTLNVQNHAATLALETADPALNGNDWACIDRVVVSIEDDPNEDGEVDISWPSEAVPLYSTNYSEAGGLASISGGTVTAPSAFGNGYTLASIDTLVTTLQEPAEHHHEDGEEHAEEEDHDHEGEGHEEHAEDEEGDDHDHDGEEHGEEEGEHHEGEGEHHDEEEDEGEEHDHDGEEHAEGEDEHHEGEGEHHDEEGDEGLHVGMSLGRAAEGHGGHDHGSGGSTGSSSLSFENASGSAEIDYTAQQIHVHLSGFPEAPAGYHYEAWAVSGDDLKERVENVVPDNGSAETVLSTNGLTMPLAGINQIQITLEADRGHSDRQSPTIVLTKTFVEASEQSEETSGGHGGHVH